MGCRKQRREGAMQQWAVLIKKQGIAENNYYIKHSLKMEEHVTQKVLLTVTTEAQWAGRQ